MTAKSTPVHKSPSIAAAVCLQPFYIVVIIAFFIYAHAQGRLTFCKRVVNDAHFTHTFNAGLRSCCFIVTKIMTVTIMINK